MPKITRRQFIKYVGGTAAALGLTELQLFKLTEALANPNAPMVVWLYYGTCGGCSISTTNMIENPAVPWIFSYPSTGIDPIPATTTVEDVVLDVIDLRYQEMIQSASGDLAIQQTGAGPKFDGLKSFFPAGGNAAQPFVVVVEGVLPDDEYQTIGRDAAAGYADLGGRQVIQQLVTSPGCAAFIAAGTCSSFGGWPGALNQTTYAQTNVTPLQNYVNALDPSKLVINVPSCPVQPEVLLLTVAGAIAYLGFGNPGWGPGPNALLQGLDGFNRPLPYYADVLHRGPAGGAYNGAFGGDIDGCPHYDQYSNGIFATKPGDDGCLITLGCKGLSTKTPCNAYKWNYKQTWCVKANHPCYGCTEKGAPDKTSPFVKVI